MQCIVLCIYLTLVNTTLYIFNRIILFLNIFKSYYISFDFEGSGAACIIDVPYYFVCLELSFPFNVLTHTIFRSLEDYNLKYTFILVEFTGAFHLYFLSKSGFNESNFVASNNSPVLPLVVYGEFLLVVSIL